MNTKSKTRQQLSAYLDGELCEAETSRVRQVVEADGELRQDLAELTATRDLLRRLPVERADQDFVARVLTEAERTRLVGASQAERPASPLRWIRYLTTAAVLLVAVSVGAIICVTLLWPPDFEGHLAYPHASSREGVPSGSGRPVADAKGTLGESIARTEGGDHFLRLSRKVATDKVGEDGVRAKARFVKDVGNMDQAIARAVENDEVIFTDRLETTQRQVEKVLVANGIQPAFAPADGYAAKKDAARNFRANFYRANQVGPRTVEFEVFVTPEQMTNVQKELDSLRARQSVSQKVAALPAAGGPASPAFAKREAEKLAEQAAPSPGPGGGGQAGAKTLVAKGPAPAAEPAAVTSKFRPAPARPVPSAETERPVDGRDVSGDAAGPRPEPSAVGKSVAKEAELERRGDQPASGPVEIARRPSAGASGLEVAPAQKPAGKAETAAELGVEPAAKPKVVSTPAPVEPPASMDSEESIADRRGGPQRGRRYGAEGVSPHRVAQTTAPAATQAIASRVESRAPLGKGLADAPADDVAPTAPQPPAMPAIVPQQAAVAQSELGDERQTARGAGQAGARQGPEVAQLGDQAGGRPAVDPQTGPPTTRPLGKFSIAAVSGQGQRTGGDQVAPDVGARDQLVQIAQTKMKDLFSRDVQGQQSTAERRLPGVPATQATQVELTTQAVQAFQGVSQQAPARLQRLRITLNFREPGQPPNAAALIEADRAGQQAAPDNAAKK